MVEIERPAQVPPKDSKPGPARPPLKAPGA